MRIPRDCATKPRIVSLRATLGTPRQCEPTPSELCPRVSSAATTQLGLRRGLHDFPGWLVPRNPGLEGTIPSGSTVGGDQPLVKRAVGDTNFSEEPENPSAKPASGGLVTYCAGTGIPTSVHSLLAASGFTHRMSATKLISVGLSGFALKMFRRLFTTLWYVAAYFSWVSLVA